MATDNKLYICQPQWYCGREARLSSAKAATAVRIRSIPLKSYPFRVAFLFKKKPSFRMALMKYCLR